MSKDLTGIKIFHFLCNIKLTNMADGQNNNWGKKGSCIGQFAVAIILFICLLIWIYSKNQNGLS